MAREYRGLPTAHIAISLDADTPIEIRAVGDDYPGRFVLRLGNRTPDVAISCDNEALARLRDVLSTHLLDSQAGER
jgi:hypothetical protein